MGGARGRNGEKKKKKEVKEANPNPNPNPPLPPVRSLCVRVSVCPSLPFFFLPFSLSGCFSLFSLLLCRYASLFCILSFFVHVFLSFFILFLCIFLFLCFSAYQSLSSHLLLPGFSSLSPCFSMGLPVFISFRFQLLFPVLIRVDVWFFVYVSLFDFLHFFLFYFCIPVFLLQVYLCVFIFNIRFLFQFFPYICFRLCFSH